MNNELRAVFEVSVVFGLRGDFIFKFSALDSAFRFQFFFASLGDAANDKQKPDKNHKKLATKCQQKTLCPSGTHKIIERLQKEKTKNHTRRKKKKNYKKKTTISYS